MKQKPKKKDAGPKERQHLTDPERFSEILRTAREASGRSVRALAREIGCGATILRRMESGEPSIQVEVFLRATQILGLRLEDFIPVGDDPDGPRHEKEFWAQVECRVSRDLAGFLSRIGQFAQSTPSSAKARAGGTAHIKIASDSGSTLQADPDAQRVMAVLWELAEEAASKGESPSANVSPSIPARILAQKSHIAVKTAYKLLEALKRERYIEPYSESRGNRAKMYRLLRQMEPDV